MFELFMFVYSCNVLSARFFAVDRALNSYFMIMIMIMFTWVTYLTLIWLGLVLGLRLGSQLSS